MAARKSPRKTTKKATTRSSSGESARGFTAEERAAMRDRAKELKAASRPRAKGESEEGDVLARIAAMQAADRALAERVHSIVMATAPGLAPRLWYGMPAYARDGKVVCFFQDAAKFKSRYATLGFSDKAMLDDGEMWPTSFALKKLTAAEEKRIVELVKRAVG
ncbi:MAG TPA: DUF1801 domain-containing protein [Gemmatimonadaceae bacterium]|nr:DUF1801 domain-containing protein [Gemmatimonadaceae bacterium]